MAIAAIAIATHVVTAAEAAAASLFLRDPDIEHGLSELAAPVLRAAGLNPKRVRVLVVNDSSLNAFVVDGQTVFLHYGLILKVQSAAMLQAVIAHEAANISNGHIARRMENLRSARTAAGLGAALAVIAATAGAGSAAGGVAAGTAPSALRGFFVQTRAEESAADRSAAHCMTSTELDPQELVDLQRAFAGQEALSVRRQNPCMQCHPLTRDRIRVAESFAAAQPAAPPPKSEDTYWFARVQGKLSAFMRAPQWTLRRAPEEPHADVRLMREAIAHHRNNDLNAALTRMDSAIAARPDDAYFYELKGQILLENRKMQEALDAYETAVALAPRESLIQGGYGRALLAADQPRAALVALEEARSGDFRDARVVRVLALAYAKLGDTGMAALTTAERHALEGRMEDAARQAQRATTLLPRGSAPWQRAQDVVIASEHANKRKKR
jgi:predicted Zn-dependent protease